MEGKGANDKLKTIPFNPKLKIKLNLFKARSFLTTTMIKNT